jgi:hypothetical protein
MKAFACLAAPPNHPFWTSTELPWPTESFPLQKAIPDPSHIMTRLGNHTFLLSSGQKPHYALRHGPAKYSKFAYSASFGFSCPTGDMDLEQLAGDNSEGVETCDGETWRVRRQPINPKIVGRGTKDVHLRSSWKPWKNVEVETYLVPPQVNSPNWYVRVHKITTSRKLQSSEAGWATYGQSEDGRALVQAFSGEKSKGGDEEIGWARAATSVGCVGVLDIGIKGHDGTRKGRLVQSDPNSNIIFSRSVLPSLLGDIPEGTTWIATGIFGVPAGRGKVPEWNEEWVKEPRIPAYIFE